MENAKFFNILSSSYDLMINFENSLKNKSENFKKFIEPNYKNALDLGCGTGVDSIALCQLGLNVTAIDHSEEMIKLAMINAENKKVKIKFSAVDLLKFDFIIGYDIIVSLGNTLSNIDKKKLNSIIKIASKNLNSNGKILIQIINYSVIPKDKDYVLNTFENENMIIVRKYSFKDDKMFFIIELTDKERQTSEQIITKIHPHSFEDFKKAANQNNLKIKIYGSLSQDIFKQDAKDLVISLTK